MSAKTEFENKWGVSIARDFQQIETIRETWTKLQDGHSSPDVNADVYRYISIVESPKEDVHPHVILLHRNNQVEVMGVGRVMKYRLPCKIGYKKIINPSLQCLIIDGGGILGKSDEDSAAVLLEELLSTLRRGEVDIVFLNRLTIDTPFYQLARTKPGRFCRMYFPKVESHLRMLVPESLDLFYQSCSQRIRRNLRRSIRRLEKEFPEQVKVVTYSRENEVQEAISAASQISRRTYQYTLGVGFEDNSQTRNRMATAARHDWLRMSVLYVKGKPYAFQLGLKYRKTCFLEKMGFDPDWKRWDVGTALFVKVLEELCRDPLVEFLDFGSGDAQYKRIYANIAWDEASIFIFAPRLYPVSVNILLSLTKGLSLFLEFILEKTRVNVWVKRRWRNKLQRKIIHEKNTVEQ